MDFNKLFQDLAWVQAESSKSKDRGALQRVIESTIEEMRPDYYSAQEILECLVSVLKLRFYDQDFTEIDWRTQRLVQALQDAHENDPEGYR